MARRSARERRCARNVVLIAVAWKVLNPDGSDGWEVTWTAGQWQGPAITWWKDGTKQHQGQHAAGKRVGQWSFWFANGQIAARGEYSDDRKVGEWAYWD
jgi:antitoxin component YwqK of YwqJK toxin-antitoxin module